MKPILPLLFCAAPLAALALAVPLAPSPTRTARAMEKAARAFLATLPAEKKAQALFDFADDERESWHFVPMARKGLPLKAMDEKQRAAALELLKTGLSARGMARAETIRALETVLIEIEQGRGPERDPDGYFVSIFGRPDSSAPWGWRFEGHHLAVNVTLAAGRVASTPVFFGANPAEVRIAHPLKGARALRDEEDAARAFLAALTPEQRRVAILSGEAPADILSGQLRRFSPLKPEGIAASSLTPAQRQKLDALIEVYAGSVAPELARIRRDAAKKAAPEKLIFAWIGETEKGKKHYYRVQGPTFLIEYDNTQNDANHIHSVWREFEGDFGRDLLAEHWKAAHSAE